MAVARNVGDASQSIKAGKWERSRLVGVEAKGKTLAIVGLGKGKKDYFEVLLFPLALLMRCSLTDLHCSRLDSRTYC